MDQNEMMIDYLMQMGMMRPDEMDLMRKQKQIEALREAAGAPMQGQMIGKHYVAPSWTQGLAQVAKGAMAGRGQQMQDQALREFVDKQRQALEDMRRRRGMGSEYGSGNEQYTPSSYGYGGGGIPSATYNE
jgi:hypothetical protein